MVLIKGIDLTQEKRPLMIDIQSDGTVWQDAGSEYIKLPEKAVQINSGEDLRFEQLKVEAERQGYNLIKKQEFVKLIPCTCGCNRRTHWHSVAESTRGWLSYECKKCGKQSPWASTEIEARKAWNTMIEEEQLNGKDGRIG